MTLRGMVGLNRTWVCALALTLSFTSFVPQTAMARDIALRVLSYNVWGLPGPLLKKPERLPEIKKLLPSLKADFVGFQEIFDRRTFILADIPDYPHVAWGPKGNGLLSSGLLIISKHPIIRKATVEFSDCTGMDCFARKGVLYAQIRVPGIGDVDVFDTHLNAEGPDSLRVGQIREMLDFIGKYSDASRPMILLGDYNSRPNSEPYELLLRETGTSDSHAVFVADHPDLPLVARNGFTSDSDRNLNKIGDGEIPSRIDYVLAAGGDHPVEVVESRLAFDEPVSGMHLSDHFGVLVDLAL